MLPSWFDALSGRKKTGKWEEFLLEKPLQQLYIAEASPSKASWCEWVDDGANNGQLWLIVVNYCV